jgi:threonine dehydrogenase-like Zn-dependent dehydrogenase
MTVAIAGDGAVGLLAVLSAKQKGAGRIICDEQSQVAAKARS